MLFLTSRGLKHDFTGFLRVPPDGDPKKFFEFEDRPPSQIVRYDKDWYFVANRLLLARNVRSRRHPKRDTADDQRHRKEQRRLQRLVQNQRGAENSE